MSKITPDPDQTNYVSTQIHSIDDVNSSVPPAPENLAKAFDPSSEMYSVNTGNANVRQLEDLKSVFSDSPQILPAPPDDFKYLVGAILVFLIFKTYKG